MRKEKGKDRFKGVDALLIAALILLFAAVIGQEIAVYAVNRRNSSLDLTLTFETNAMETEEAQALSLAQTASKDGLTVRLGGESIGKLSGRLTDLANEEREKLPDHLSILSGQLACKGKIEDGVCSLYGYGEIEQGDVLTVRIDGKNVALRLTQIKADGEN